MDAKPGRWTMVENYFAVANVAADGGLARDFLFRRIDADALIADSVGNLRRFRLSNVDAWVREGSALEGHETPTTPRNS